MFRLKTLIILLSFFQLTLTFTIPESRQVERDIPTVSYCDLIRNPELYHQKVIRVHAKYRVGAKWSNLYHPNCGRPNETWVNFDTTYFDESFHPCEKLNVAEGIKFKGYDQDFDAILVGKFYGSKETNYGRNGSKFMLVVGCVEKAKLVKTSKADVTTLSYCELVRNPTLYNKRVIRVRGMYSSGFESSTFDSSRCNGVERGITWVDLDELYKTCTSKDVEKVFDDLMGASDAESFMNRKRAYVVFLGYFEVSPTYRITNDFPREGFGHLGMYENRITVKCIERAEKLAGN